MELQPPIRGLFYALNALVDADNTGKPVFVHILFVRCRIGGEENIRCEITQLGGLAEGGSLFLHLSFNNAMQFIRPEHISVGKVSYQPFLLLSIKLEDELKAGQSNISSGTEFEVLSWLRDGSLRSPQPS